MTDIIDSTSETAPSRRELFGACALAGGVLLTSAAVAAEEEETGPGVNPLVVDVPGIVVPIASGSTLVNYLFTTVRVTAANNQSAGQIRNHQFLVRDSIVRATGRNPIQSTGTVTAYDVASAGAILKAAIEGGFRGVRLTSVQLRDPQTMRS
jgi:hypothetical protein